MTSLVQTDPDGPQLEPNLERAALVIAAGGTRQKAANIAECSVRHLYYQLQHNAALKAYLSKLQDAETTRIQRYLTSKGNLAAATLVGVVRGHIQASPTRMEALKTLLSYSLGRPAQGSVAIEAHTDQDGNTIRIIVGHPPRE
jgi:hypothetical protein